MSPDLTWILDLMEVWGAPAWPPPGAKGTPIPPSGPGAADAAARAAATMEPFLLEEAAPPDARLPPKSPSRVS